MDEERPFYCERAQRNCPFESRFRYCWDCKDHWYSQEEDHNAED